jgi:hypothetical protein
MVIDSPPRLDDLRPRETWLRRRADKLLARFRRVFREIRYDLAWYSDTVNAQAFVRDQKKCVRLYGGLARHRRVSLAGIAYVLAHETGHHLAGPPFDATYFWLSSEDQADSWAFNEGMMRAFGPLKGARLASRGLREIVALSPHGDTRRESRVQLLGE